MLRNFWKAGIAVVVLTIGLAATAEAQIGYRGNLNGGIGAGVYSRGVYNYGGYGNRYNTYRPYNTYYGGGPVWHDTSHYHYHPGGFVPHRNHYHYVPGHYDLHRSGHYHW
jgi:hypothetical protein